MKNLSLTLVAFLLVHLCLAQKQNVQKVIEKLHAKYESNTDGHNADYIPYLANVDSNLFGISVVDTDGKIYSTGDVSYEFGIESISKVMVYCLAMKYYSSDTLAKLLGVNATGLPFNSVTAVELNTLRTVNPFVNAGAMATNSLIPGNLKERNKTIDTYMNAMANRELSVIDELYQSEMETNQHNVGIAVLLESYGYMYSDPYMATDSYTRQCSYGVTANDLAMMAAVLANNGIHPITKEVLIESENVPKVLAVMATAGVYDDSGKWLFRVGLPAKSGVGGGIIAVAPGKYGICVFSPRLDVAGNSVKAQLVMEKLSQQLQLNVLHGK
jgi:glutaminase